MGFTPRLDWRSPSALIEFISNYVRPGGGMVDTGDLKSLASNGVRVQVPPRVPPLIATSIILILFIH